MIPKNREAASVETSTGNFIFGFNLLSSGRQPSPPSFCIYFVANSIVDVWTVWSWASSLKNVFVYSVCAMAFHRWSGLLSSVHGCHSFPIILTAPHLGFLLTIVQFFTEIKTLCCLAVCLRTALSLKKQTCINFLSFVTIPCISYRHLLFFSQTPIVNTQ